MVQGELPEFLYFVLTVSVTNMDITQIWLFFLGWSTIASRQGTATCYQIVLVKNINSTHRVEGIPSQFGLTGALNQSKVDMKAWAVKEAKEFPSTAAR